MIQPKLPDVKDACLLFRELANQQENCTSRKVNKPLMLYGAGDLGKMAKEFFERMKIPFMYVVDEKPERYIGDTTWKGIAILKPDKVPKDDIARSLLVICIVKASYESILAPLIKLGWHDIVPFYDITEAYTDSCPLSNGWFAGTFNEDDMEGIEYALSHWADDISRAHHLQFIAWHKLRKELIFDGAPVTTENRFFIPEVTASLNENEIFFDGGAHYGDVSSRFVNIVHNKFKKIYANEPDKYNVKVLCKNLGNINVSASREIKILDCALGKKSGSLPFFHGLGYASQFSSMAKESVLVQTLDEMDIPVTFIKLHLEGWEYDALQGAMHTIHKHRPLLAVTTYHKRNGLWQIPVFLMKNLQGYVFLLRLHSWMGTGCVLYAIPRERYSC